MSIKRNQVDRNSDSKKFDITISIDELLKDSGLVESDVDFEWLKKIIDDASTEKRKEPPVDLLKNSYEKTTDEEKRRLIKIFQIALHDNRFAEKLISAVNFNNHRKFLFNHLLFCAEQRVDILRKQPACFLNFVIIFGDYFHAYELSSPIVETLLACLMILLNIEATQGIELVTIVLSKIGLKMTIRFPTLDTDTLFHRIHHILLNGDISSRSRILLMLVIALNDQKFLPFPDNHYLLEFYTTELGESTMTKIQNNLKAF